MIGTARLRPVCDASMTSYTAYLSSHDKGTDGRMACVSCGRVVKLIKRGLDRYPSHFPHHHIPATHQPTKEAE